MNIQDHVRIVPNFPKPGINFYDIATLLSEPQAWREAIWQLQQKIEPYQPERLMGIESRGFLVAAPLAMEMGCSFGMVRKKGKLPGQTLSYRYDLEYGTDEIEIQPDLVTPGMKVVLVDDILATGGTMAAAEQLLIKAGVEVIACFCLIELDGLNGRGRLQAPFESLMVCPA